MATKTKNELDAIVCPFGCQDQDYGAETPSGDCTCSPEQIVAGIKRLNRLGVKVVFAP